jgi:hypothetical protein
MFDTRNLLAVFVLVSPRRLAPDKLRAALWMLTFTQSREVVGSHGATQTPLFGKSATPLAVCESVSAPVVLLLRSELTRVVSLSLPCGEGLRDGQHALELRERARQHLAVPCHID